MRETGGKSFWFTALLLSLAAHALLLLFIPDFTPQSEVRPIMKVRLAMTEKKSASVPAPAPVREELSVRKNTVSQKAPVTKTEPPKKAKPAKAVKTAADPPSARQGEPAAETMDSRAETSTAINSDTAVPDKDPLLPQTQTEKVAEIDTLEVVKKILPNYSSFSRKRKEEGTVVIIATVTDGRVVNAEVESSSGYPRLDESALRAVRQWLFKNSGTLKVRVPVLFRLK